MIGNNAQGSSSHFVTCSKVKKQEDDEERVALKHLVSINNELCLTLAYSLNCGVLGGFRMVDMITMDLKDHMTC